MRPVTARYLMKVIRSVAEWGEEEKLFYHRGFKIGVSREGYDEGGEVVVI